MTTAIAEREAPTVSKDELDLIRKTVANGATDAELKLFLFDCSRRGIHPLDKLLHFTKRGGRYTPVTSIDFMRAQAAMTGEMAGSDDAKHEWGEDPNLPYSATVTVYRITQGTRYPYTATARWSEYCPANADMWRKMPHTMLAKCAEALALRKAFPQQLAGLYAKEEMDQAEKAGYVVEAPAGVVEADTAAPRAAVGQPRVSHDERAAVPRREGDASRPDMQVSTPAPGTTSELVDVDTGECDALPPGVDRIIKVEPDTGKVKGWIHTYPMALNKPGIACFKEPLVKILEQCCQDGVLVKLRRKVSATSGKEYVDGVERVELPKSWKPFAKEPATADADFLNNRGGHRR